MSYDPCTYCREMAYKTDGNGHLICYNRANTGDCMKAPENEKYQGNITLPSQRKKSGNEMCRHSKKIRNCKKCMGDPTALAKAGL